MKKSARNRIIIWSVISALLICALVAGMLAMSSFPMFGINYHHIDFSNYESGNAEFGRNDVTDFDIEWAGGSVTLKEGKGDIITIHEEGASDNKMQYRLDDGKLKIYHSKDIFWFFGNTDQKDLIVTVPKNKEIDEFSVSTASADVSIDLRSIISDLKINTASGDVKLENVGGGKFYADSASGDVTAKNCMFMDIDVTTVSGSSEINTDAACENFSADSVSGNVDVYFNDLYINGKLVSPRMDKIDCNTVSGYARIFLPENIEGFEADLDTVSGGKLTDFDCFERDGKLIYGNGRIDIEIDTVSGYMEIDKIK